LVWQTILGRPSEARGLVHPAEIAVPDHPIGWVLIGRGSRGDDGQSLVRVGAALRSASLATVTIDLPWRTPAAADRVRSVAADLRGDLAGGLPIAYLGRGSRAAAGWIASRGGGLDGVIAWNGRAGVSWRVLRYVGAPSLLLVDDDRVDLPWQLLRAKAISWRLGGGAELELIGGDRPVDPGLLTRWYEDRIVCPVSNLLPARRHHRSQRHVRASVGVIAALAVPALGALALEPSALAKMPNFASGTTLSARDIAGDSASSSTARKVSDKNAGQRLDAGDILGDGVVPHATGSRGLIDGDGVQYFINTDITFPTSSSASGGMSEASYTHSVSATTANGGETQSRLNDAYDGYETLCISTDNTTGFCHTGSADWNIYNDNGPASVESNGQQVDFPVQAIGSLNVSRKVFVPNDDGFARWLDIITNTGSSDATMTVGIANNLGSDSNTIITNDSSGNTAPSIADTWAATFQNYSGTVSTDPRLGHVFSSPGATVGLAAMNFANGDDNPWWNYTVTIPAGQTRIIMNYGVVQASKAAAATKSEQLADLDDAHQLDLLSDAERAEVLNFAVPTNAVADSYSLSAETPFDEPVPGVLGNDPDTSELSAVLVAGPSHAASFKLNPDGSFSYTPSPGFAGTDTFTYASKGLGGGVSEPTTVTLDVVGRPPSFTSNAAAQFTVGTAGSFTIRAAGLPTPSITEAPPLPAGLTFTDNHDGTATISGTPAAGTQGSYPIMVTSANGQGSNATQTLTLAVGAAVTPAPPATTPAPTAPAPAPAPAPTPLAISNVGLSRSDVVWCFGHGCQYPNTHIRFTLNRAATVRLVLQANAKGSWKKVAVAMVSGHGGSNSRVLAGRWHGGLVPARKVRILVQLKAGGHFTTRKTLFVRVKHRHK
jgi:hypothetical protein